MNIKKNIFLFKDVMFLKGVGLQTKKYLEKTKADEKYAKNLSKKYYNMISFDEEIAISMPLIKEEEEQEQEEISKVSYTNIIYRYIVTPQVFFSHVYESITTMSWKFYS